MTDPRIEAAARSIWMDMQDAGTEISFENASTVNRAMALSLARNALAAADQATWRTIESAPKEETIIACGGNLYGPAVVKWSGLLGNPHWDYSIENHPDEIESPTHWQPLPSPPAVDVGGGNG